MKTILKFIGLKIVEITGIIVISYFGGKLVGIPICYCMDNTFIESHKAVQWILGIIIFYVVLILSFIIILLLWDLIKWNWKLAKEKWL